MRPRTARGLRDLLRAQPTETDYHLEDVAGEKTVAWLKRLGGPGGKLFLFLVRDERHFYVKGQSVGVARWVFQDAVGRGAQTVVVAYEGRGTFWLYKAPVLLWKRRGFIVKHEGYEEQLHLKVKLMEVWEVDR